ncbi:GAF domain-containing protein [Chitinophaga silvisoli]|uniref:GAF domain-containing protein n=2 Tax=Chitinophaga silvisoli TaxID=2291814 RepID=A0A3E1NXE6_9BACT|nr:GAF domain-containing protein [Chitinophaga silvisoli]
MVVKQLIDFFISRDFLLYLVNSHFQFTPFSEPPVPEIFITFTLPDDIMRSQTSKAALDDIDAINRHITNISNTVTPVSSRRQLMNSIQMEMRKIIDFDSSYIAVYNQDYLSCTCCTENLLPQVAAGIPSAQALPCTGPVKHSKPFTFRFDEAGNALYGQLPLAAIHRDKGFKTACIIPLIMQGVLMGYLMIASLHDDHFHPAHLSIFEKVAGPIATGVSNVLLYEKLLVAREEKNQLLAISEAMATVRDKDALFKMMIDRIQPILGFDRGAQIYTISQDKATVFFPDDFASDPAFQEIAAYGFPIIGSPLETVLATGEIFPIYRESPYKDALIIRMMDRLQINSGIMAPLRIGGTIIGSFQVFSSGREALTKEQYPLFQGIADQVALAVQHISLQGEAPVPPSHFEEIISRSKKLLEIFRNIQLVSRTDTTVLLLGETGTGKELFAKAIHNLSARKGKTLIKLNCAALPAHLIESELFGHERGAFTGAIDRRIGKFEIADGSTLFLDEIGELPLELQAKLLRALQEKEIERLGSNKVIKTNVRIIAATNRDLQKEVAAGRFRSDLYFRLNVFPILLPPLRERKEDIPLLANHFLRKMEEKLGREFRGMSTKVIQELTNYSWPGNIRELEHVIERSAIVTKGKVMTSLHLPPFPEESPSAGVQQWSLKTWKEHEKEYILQALNLCNGRVSGAKGAAKILDIPPTTLESKMRKLGIRKQHFPME